jgi:hypothetical protein
MNCCEYDPLGFVLQVSKYLDIYGQSVLSALVTSVIVVQLVEL